MPWIVGVTKPNAEAVAATNLERQGYGYYYPRIRQAKPGKEPRVEPLFRRYIFIHITDRWYSLRSTRGMHHLLMGEDGPKLVSPLVISALRAREASDGLIRLAQRPPKYRVGQKVKVEDGPFAGRYALYEGQAPRARSHVLLSLLGAEVKVTLDERVLTAA